MRYSTRYQSNQTKISSPKGRDQTTRPRAVASSRWVSLLGLLPLLLIAFSSAGCPDKKAKYPTCGSDKDCKDGQHCFQKQCSQCSEDSHCEDFERCDQGSCVLQDDKCRTNDDCVKGQICLKNTCTSCESDEQCGPNAKCSDGACLERGSCTKDEDCADDEDCIDGTCQQPGRSAPPELSCTLDSVYFDLNVYSVGTEFTETLQKNSECIQEASDRSIFVEGHTDDQGTDEYNIALSEKRARSVADFLARLGIDPVRLQVVPKGESESTGGDEDSRAEQRRVDFEWK